MPPPLIPPSPPSPATPVAVTGGSAPLVARPRSRRSSVLNFLVVARRREQLHRLPSPPSLLLHLAARCPTAARLLSAACPRSLAATRRAVINALVVYRGRLVISFGQPGLKEGEGSHCSTGIRSAVASTNQRVKPGPTMEPSEGFMGSVISKFSRLLALEFSLPEDMDKLIRNVYGYLRVTRAYNCIESDAKMSRLSPMWGTNLMAVFYRAENVVDSILVHTEHSETAANQEDFNRLFLKASYSLELLDEISWTLVKLRDTIQEVETSVLPIPYEKRPELVGIEKPRDVLINMLAQGDE